VANLSPYFEVVLIENTIFSVEFPVDPCDSKIKIKFLCKSKGYIYVYLSSVNAIMLLGYDYCKHLATIKVNVLYHLIIIYLMVYSGTFCVFPYVVSTVYYQLMHTNVDPFNSCFDTFVIVSIKNPKAIIFIKKKPFRNMSVVNSEENCTLLKDSFANSTAEFISCAIYNSRPITMCENCVQQYINILEDYNNMKKVTIQ
jgi:hypothetical protein